MQTLGFLELNSIAKGIEAADCMLKAAEVRLVVAKPNCPGKYQVMICGDVAAVQASVDAGEKIGSSNVINKLVIARVDEQVLKAISATTLPSHVRAIGVMEFFDITTAILSADTAVKTADISLLDIRLGAGIGGKSFVIVSGEVAAVQQAIDSGCSSAKERGSLINAVVIPNPVMELFDSLA